MVKRLREDLIGPLGGPEEQITDRPTDRYLTGMLFPPKTRIEQIENEDGVEPADAGSSESTDESLPFSSAMRPASMGMSFAVRATGEHPAAIDVLVRAGVYTASGGHNGTPVVWHRREVLHEDTISIGEIAAGSGSHRLSHPADFEIQGAQLYVRAAEVANGLMLVTIALSNVQRAGSDGAEPDEQVFFQVEMEARPAPGSKFVAKPASRLQADDEDIASGNLIYRDVQDYVVGHTCAARWEEAEDEVVAVCTEWLPTSVVRKPRETGDPTFEDLTRAEMIAPLDARWLSEAPRDSVLSGLDYLAELYENWINERDREKQAIGDVVLKGQADLHIKDARKAIERIRAGVTLLRDDPLALDAFRLANRALWLQDHWKKNRQGRMDGLIWRPFQLAFVLLTLTSASNEQDDDREIMDLLWFPTGGGKTEAYLLLTAHVIFMRRLRASGDPDGAGVTVFMRYTLRLLTIQQFQRAAAMIFACDLIRRGAAPAGAVLLPSHFREDTPISIGLWVGAESVPNKTADALDALKRERAGEQPAASPRRLTRCPECDGALQWGPSNDGARVVVRCEQKPACSLSQGFLPVWTVDEDIYEILPSLMIGTADKYAQLAREARTGRLFGIGTNHAPPSLIIQDELHLISGPLGTISGLYEIAVDELCGHRGTRPKIIGSTATIRRAGSQIRALFDRKAAQFPPAGLDHGNSGFAATDPDDPGRLYVGVTTTGRSAKFTLQAVMASLMQSASDNQIPEDLGDSYWTLVTYFNSLRELGGALTLSRDDVGRSVEQYAQRRENEAARMISSPVELTSRVSASEINEILDQLELKRGEDNCVSSVLASNMISVGVDVTRLGAMVVNGQPKTIAEYIQATSRVGRGAVPGLVVAICNANKPRDRSRYETFQNWHRSLYRDVEATGVTPFAERARERALHAAFVICGRHLIPELRLKPSAAGQHRAELNEILERIVARARSAEQSVAETDAVEAELKAFLELWIERNDIQHYWDKRKSTLLVSAEEAEESGHAGGGVRLPKATPNSLRSVEASTAFSLRYSGK
ncbi:DNA helicase [Rhizobium ruizarguesonis]|uniref:helicase-related protein n=1 Tax=Rhizobium ruizarguesonis TaxID=2081791 RepID=UPI00102FE6D0|nr:helicase-related protein [Rhizobium ruizarguesonis]TAZ73772.1 DNA helicase [Rhizobium ruizarguesonis]TBA00391.1 DNA helicase [Rhizobium ruizarguesonis]